MLAIYYTEYKRYNYDCVTIEQDECESVQLTDVLGSLVEWIEEGHHEVDGHSQVECYV